MKMSELIVAIGDDNIEFQNLDHALINAEFSQRKGSRITFGTQQPLHPFEGTKKLGLIIWLDRDAVASAMSKEGGAA